MLPASTDNNRLAQRAFGKQKRSIIERIDLGVFVSQAQTLSAQCGQGKKGEMI
jgi:hypothetical protein